MVACAKSADESKREALAAAGCEVLLLEAKDDNAQLNELFQRLAERGMMNVLVEGGSQLLGSLFDAKLIDEVHAFIATKLIGGTGSLPPLGGSGLEKMAAAVSLHQPTIETLDGDIYVHGRIE